MAIDETDTSALQPTLGSLERALIDDFLQVRGFDTAMVAELPDEKRRALMTEACLFASAKLTEIESRSRLLHDLHGEPAGRIRTHGPE